MTWFNPNPNPNPKPNPNPNTNSSFMLEVLVNNQQLISRDLFSRISVPSK